MSTIKLLFATAIAMALLTLAPTSPAAAATSVPSCTTDPNSNSKVVGDDVCTADADSMFVLAAANADGPDIAAVDILGNDGLEGASCWDITSDATTSGVDVMYLDLIKDIPGNGLSYCTFSISLSSSAAGTYTFSYTLRDGGTRTVTLNVNPYVPPIKPTVKKVRKPGYVRVCNRETYGLDFYDRGLHKRLMHGPKFVAAKSCKRVRVYWHNIAWVALGHRDGVFMGNGVVRHIALPASASSRNVTSGSLAPTGALSWLLSRS